MKRVASREEERLRLEDLFFIDMGLIVCILNWMKMRVVQLFLEAVSPILRRITPAKRTELLTNLRERWPHHFQELGLAPLPSIARFAQKTWCKRCKMRESVHKFGEPELTLDLCDECDKEIKPLQNRLVSERFRDDGWQWITELEMTALLYLGIQTCAPKYARENGLRFRDPVGPGWKFKILGTTDQYYEMPPNEFYLLKDVMKKRVEIKSINH